MWCVEGMKNEQLLFFAYFDLYIIYTEKQQCREAQVLPMHNAHIHKLHRSACAVCAYVQSAQTDMFVDHALFLYRPAMSRRALVSIWHGSHVRGGCCCTVKSGQACMLKCLLSSAVVCIVCYRWGLSCTMVCSHPFPWQSIWHSFGAFTAPSHLCLPSMTGMP